MKTANRTIKRLFISLLTLLLFVTMAPLAFGGGPTTTVNISVKCVLSGQPSPDAQILNFELGAVGGAPMPAGSANGKKTAAVTTKSAGTASFGDITFTGAGMYKYTVRQIAGSLSCISYDGSVYDATIMVAWKNDVVDTELVPTVVFTKQDGTKTGELLFTSRYAPNPLLVVDPPVHKVVSGDRPSSDGRFTFVMQAMAAGYPMPPGSVNGVKKMTIIGSGSQDFGNYTYTAAGVYSYRIYEELESLEGYAYDRTVYTFTDTVTDNGGALQYSRVIQRADGVATSQSEMMFTNKYTASASASTGPRTGDDSNVTFFIILTAFALAGLIALLVLYRKQKKQDAIAGSALSNDASSGQKKDE